MTLPLHDSLDTASICRKFKEMFGADLFWHALPPHCDTIVFYLGRGEALTTTERNWISDRCNVPALPTASANL